MDMHAHSKASSGPAIAALGFLGCAESYSEPERVYDLAKARGMRLVTLTDHDTIEGALSLVARGFQDVVIGEEVTVHFPEDRCKLHVLVWGLQPDEHEQIGRLRLRDDVYAFAAWLWERNLAHSLAHPLYIQNGRLTRRHLDRCALLFKGFEILNGAHSGTHRDALARYLGWLTPATVHRLIGEHGIEPFWPRIWEKALTAGSDDHGLLNVGRTHTSVPLDFEERAAEPGEFLRRVMTGRAEVGGAGGHSSLLAHQLTTVAAEYASRRIVPKLNPAGRALCAKFLPFAGVKGARPSTLSLIVERARRAVMRKRANPALRALRQSFGPVLARYPELAERLGDASRGSALSEHERMAEFADDLHAAVQGVVGSGLFQAILKRDGRSVADHVASCLLVELSQIPYMFSLFHQNKERQFLDRLRRDCASAGEQSHAEPPMRVSLFTDTLGDVNGVCRFIQNVASRAQGTGRDLQVITSTRFPVPSSSNVFNFDPVFATRMPGYENLEICLPPLTRILRHIDRHQPDVVHISTPGSVGLIGMLAAKMLRVPVLGVYHTDFPAYIDDLFDDRAFTWTCERYMKWFYSPFRAVFTRSADYVERLGALGIERSRCTPLAPGVDTQAFSPRFRDPSLWSRLGLDPTSAKVLYCGRVSVEKNLPLLTKVWKLAQSRCARAGVRAELVVVGDGPYRATMEPELAGQSAHFLGFRFGAELAALYASSDFFVFPSVTDTLGQVVMESQASALPVIVTDQGGPKEVVRHGETGYVLSATDVNAWAQRVFELAARADQRRAMGEAAHRSMQSHSLDESFEHFWSVHEEAHRKHVGERSVAEDGAPAVRFREGVGAASAVPADAATQAEPVGVSAGV